MEIFKDVKGYEGYYEISNLGRVRSTSYKGVKILKPFITKKGYLNVIFCVKRKTEHKLIHRLVAEAFIPNPNNLPEVNHKNRDTSDNTVNNLEWVSKQENIDHLHIERKSLIDLYNLSLKEGLSVSAMLNKLMLSYLIMQTQCS